jgi:fimbrial chaperone protein
MKTNLVRFKWALPLALGLSLLGTHTALAGAAFRLSPPRMVFTPSGSGATQSFRIESTGDRPVAVQIQMAQRQVNIDGIETQPSAEADFAVYPPQILLKPGESQTVRVTWLGDPNPSKELAYRIIAEQLSVDNLPEVEQPQKGAIVKVKALYRYVGSIFITPKKVAPKVVLEQAACQPEPGKANQLKLNFANQGTAHTYLSGLKLHLSPPEQKSKIVHLMPDQLKGINGENLLAGNKRQFTLACPTDFPVGPVSATFEFVANQ